MSNTLHLDSLIAPGEPAVRVMAGFATAALRATSSATLRASASASMP